jgi:hypothetical protein
MRGWLQHVILSITVQAGALLAAIHASSAMALVSMVAIA